MSRILSIGQHIRSMLFLPDEVAQRRYPVYTAYDLWYIYNKKQKDLKYKGIKYNNFLKYIYMLKRLSLIEEIKGAKKRILTPAGVRTIEASKKPKAGKDHPSNFIPKDWERKFFRINKDLKFSPLWDNPKFEYYKSIGSIIYVEGKPVTKQQLERMGKPKEKKVSKAPLYPSYVKTTHIRITKELKAMIDRKKGERSIEDFLFQLVTSI